MFIAKLKEALLCLKAGRVTLPYPFVPLETKDGFRGQPEVEGRKCLGCGTCAGVCPPRSINLVDEGEHRVFKLDYSRCTYCARCADVCPEGAIRLNNRFELATAKKEDLSMTVKLKMAECSLCGRPFTPERLLKKTIEKLTGDAFGAEPPEWLYWCPECRKTRTAKTLAGMEGPEHA